MKRLLWIIAGLIVIIGIGMTVVQMNQQNESNEPAMNQSQKALVVYFSMSGSTKTAADRIAKETGADEIRLEPEKAYPSDYQDYAARGEKEKDGNVHPAIKTTISNLADYDTVFVGFPTWWSQPPMIIHSLFEKFNFSGKTIVPFTTSMSDPVSKSMPTMKKLAKADDAKIIDGFRYDNNNQALSDYLDKNKLK